MLHAFRIGPFAETPEPCFLYAARAPTGDVHATQASDDVEGLRMLMDELGGQPVLVEPLLAKAGKRLGLRRAPLPPELACEKATMALALVLRMHELVGDRVAPFLVADLLDAAIAFHRAAPWRFVDSDVPLKVEVNDGKRKRTIDGALMGSRGEEFGLALYPSPACCDVCSRRPTPSGWPRVRSSWRCRSSASRLGSRRQ